MLVFREEGQSHHSVYLYINLIVLDFLPCSSTLAGLCFSLYMPIIILKYGRSLLMKMLIFQLLLSLGFVGFLY